MLKTTTVTTIALLIFGQVKGHENGITNSERLLPDDSILLGAVRCTPYLIESYMIKDTEESYKPKPVCEMDAEFEGGIEGILYELEGVPPDFYSDVEFGQTSIYISKTKRDRRRFNSDSDRFKLEIDPTAAITKVNIGNDRGSGGEEGQEEQGQHQRSLRGGGADSVVVAKDHARRRLDPLVGKRSLLIIYSVPTSGPQNDEVSASQIANELFGDLCTDPECTDDPVNLRSQVLDCSKNQLEYVPACGVGSFCEGDPDIINGVLQVSVGDVTGMASGTVVNWAMAAANTILRSKSMAVSNFTQVMHIIPSEARWGNSGAWAQISGTLSAFQDRFSNRMGIQVHELGHNMGLQHSGSVAGRYADHTCIMGNPSFGDDGVKVCFNGAKSWESGWYTEKQYTVNPNDGFDGLLVGVADFVTNSYTDDHYVVLQIIDTTRTLDYYIMYNRKKGPNDGVTFAADKVTITMGKPRRASWHLAALGTNTDPNSFEKFRVANFNGGHQDLVIKVCSLTDGPPDTAHVLVYLDDGPAYNNGQMCPGEVQCLSDSDCEDGDLCSVNICDQNINECVAPTDVVCQDDGVSCNGEYACNVETGNCELTGDDELTICDDGNPCTNDSCDIDSDSCLHIGIPGCQVPGAIIETWTGISGTSVTELTAAVGYPDSPDDASVLADGLEAPRNAVVADFGSRVRGYIVPFESGEYTFYIASDDNGELLLSSSIDPEQAVTIASVPGWTEPRQWTKYPEQKSEPVQLMKGAAYYIEALHKQAGGGDNNLAIAWESPAGSANIPLQVIGAEHVFMYPPVPCMLDSDCGVSDWCTQITCNLDTSLCETVDISADRCPDDGLFCSGVNRCNPVEERCEFITEFDLCFDKNPCTEDRCDDGQGGCLNIPIEGCENGALFETWSGISDTRISALTEDPDYPDFPDESVILTNLLEAPTNRGSNFGSRLRTHIVPPASGSYTFYISSDNHGQLFLGTSSDPASAVSIASVPGWTSPRDWDKYTSQKSNPINLMGGEAYYLEALYKEGAGYDNLAIAWESMENGISLEVIKTSYTILHVTPIPTLSQNILPLEDSSLSRGSHP